MLRETMYLLMLMSYLCLSSCNGNDKKNNGANDSLTIINDTTAGTSSNDLSDNINRMNELSTFSGLLAKADLIQILKKPGPFTIFAPTNEAFNKLPPGLLNELMDRQKDLFCGSHIVAGLLTIGDLENGQKLKTLSGVELIVSLIKNEQAINGAKILQHDILSQNGVIHVIDQVILPAGQL